MDTALTTAPLTPEQVATCGQDVTTSHLDIAVDRPEDRPGCGGAIARACSTEFFEAEYGNLDAEQRLSAEEACVACLAMEEPEPVVDLSTVNVALHKPVTMSSTNYSPLKATDGYTCNRMHGGPECGVAHTLSEFNACIDVDLQEDIALSRVVVWNGWEHCCRGRINPFVVIFSDSNGAEIARTGSLRMRGSTYEAMDIPAPTTLPVRHVRVQLDGHNNYLHVAEIQAYGTR